MTTDIHAALEAKYKASAQDPACAEELRHFTDGWNAARSGNGPGREAFERWIINDGRMSLTRGLYGGYLHADTARAWDAWQARDAEIAALREVLVNARQALQEANEAGSGGPIQDTIWMPASISSAETLFDYLDAAIAQTTAQTRHGDSHIALKDRTVRAMLTHYEKWGDTEGFGQMVQAVKELFYPEARQIRGDGKP